MVLGRDFAGFVERTGAAVTRYAVGNNVFGFVPAANPTVHEGSWAEVIVVPQDQLAHKPVGVDPKQAGAAPLAAITAILAHDALHLDQGVTVLVVGASGGVGTLAVQLDAHAGADVIGPGLPEDEDYLRGLGVRCCGQPFSAAVRRAAVGWAVTWNIRTHRHTSLPR